MTDTIETAIDKAQAKADAVDAAHHIFRAEEAKAAEVYRRTGSFLRFQSADDVVAGCLGKIELAVNEYMEALYHAQGLERETHKWPKPLTNTKL